MTGSPFSVEFSRRYEILGLLGEGGGAKVYRARHRELDRPVAIKVFTTAILEDEHSIRRFLDEGRTLAQLRHPNVVAVYETGLEGGAPYLALELVEGRDLRTLLADRIRDSRRAGNPGGLPPLEAVTLFAGIAAGLAEVHRHGIVHRDLKPENVLVGRDTVARLADFGLALAGGDDRPYRTRRGLILGTPRYVAPERVRTQEARPPSDVYAFGIMLWECLAGRPPIEAKTDAELLLAHTRGRIPPASQQCPGLPGLLDDLVADCLAKDPEDRPTASELADRLIQAEREWGRWSRIPSRAAGMPSPLSPGSDPKELPSRVPARRGPLQDRMGTRTRRILATIFVLTGLALLGRFLSRPFDPVLEPIGSGFRVRWNTLLPAAPEVAFRMPTEAGWTRRTVDRFSTRHEMAVGPLEPGLREVALVGLTGWTHLGGIEVRPLAVRAPRVVETSGGRILDLSTSLPARVALLASAGSPTAVSTSPHGEIHRLDCEPPILDSWQDPLLVLTDSAARQVRVPLGISIPGAVPQARSLAGRLAAFRLDETGFRTRLEEARQAALETGEGRIQDLADEIRSLDPSIAERAAVLEARSRWLGEVPGGLEAAYQDLPFRKELARFAPRARSFFSDPGVPRTTKLALYHALLDQLGLDASADAEGAPPPLGIQTMLAGAARLEVVPGDRIRDRLEQESSPPARVLFAGRTLAEQTMILAESRVVENRRGVMDFASLVGQSVLSVDVARAARSREGEVQLEAAPGGRRLVLHGWNLFPHFLLEIGFHPLDAGSTPGGPETVRLVFRTESRTFPGGAVEVQGLPRNRSLLVLHLAPWLLPPGRYRWRLAGRTVPGTYRGLIYQVSDLLLGPGASE